MGEAPLERRQIRLVEDEPFQVYPTAFEEDFYPTVDDAARCKEIPQTSDSTFLKLLVYGEAMESTWHAHCTQQGHQQGAFRVALADTFGQNS